VKARKKNPRTGLPLTRTQCNRCGESFPGRVLHADQAYCPKCEIILDRETKRARFAPGRDAPAVNKPAEGEK
jgi:ribosomal protein S27AE